jgi:NAD(P)-dependent dehydrogenase (short-subunit alcohol dehydrogenase family)
VSAPRVALVTGASGGIGFAVVERLVKAGRRVVASGRDTARLAELAASNPGQIEILAADLSGAGAAEALFARALQASARIDELVCSAGVVRYAPVGQVSEEDLRAQLELNFVSVFLLTQQASMHMKAHGRGSVVLLASTLGERPAPATSAYAATKAAVIQLSRAFALELAPSVRVNVVSPGIVDTPMVRVSRDGSQLDGAQLEQHMKKLAALHPLGRTGTPEEVAEAVQFVLEAEWMTGSVLTLDGGVSLA